MRRRGGLRGFDVEAEPGVALARAVIICITAKSPFTWDENRQMS
jgi:hypothetical protein